MANIERKPENGKKKKRKTVKGWSINAIAIFGLKVSRLLILIKIQRVIIFIASFILFYFCYILVYIY